MPDIGYMDYTAAQVATAVPQTRRALPRRALLVATACAAILLGFLVTGSHDSTRAVAEAGPALTRLLRAMAGMKAMAAAGLIAATLWRLGEPISPVRFAGYVVACAAMAVGPGLIWGMAHLRLGALLLHGGLLASVVLLFRDPAMAARLHAAAARRRLALQS